MADGPTIGWTGDSPAPHLSGCDDAPVRVDDGSRLRGRPTIAAVAAGAGVSRTTLSHALIGLGKVNPQTRKLVERIAGEIGYRPSARAMALRGGRSNVPNQATVTNVVESTSPPPPSKVMLSGVSAKITVGGAPRDGLNFAIQCSSRARRA